MYVSLFRVAYFILCQALCFKIFCELNSLHEQSPTKISPDITIKI